MSLFHRWVNWALERLTTLPSHLNNGTEIEPRSVWVQRHWDWTHICPLCLITICYLANIVNRGMCRSCQNPRTHGNHWCSHLSRNLAINFQMLQLCDIAEGTWALGFNLEFQSHITSFVIWDRLTSLRLFFTYAKADKSDLTGLLRGLNNLMDNR